MKTKRGKVLLSIREGDVRQIAGDCGYTLTDDQLAEVCYALRTDECVIIALSEAVEEIIDGMGIARPDPVG